MASLTKKLLGGFAAAALIATPIAAYAEENTAKTTTTESTAAANQNVSTAGTQTQSNFRAVDLSSQTPEYILQVALNNAAQTNIVIAWGGTKSLQDQTHAGIIDFNKDYPNMRVVLIEGPELNGYRGDIEIDFILQGTKKSIRSSQGINRIETMRQDTYNFAQKSFGATSQQ